MTPLRLLAFIALLLSPSVSFAEEKYDIIIKVDGMVCDFCAQSLNKVFSKKASVESINVDLDTSSVGVHLKDGQNLTDDEIKELIEWGGYDLVAIER